AIEDFAYDVHAPSIVAQFLFIAAMIGVVACTARRAAVSRLAIVIPSGRYIAAALLIGIGSPMLVKWLSYPTYAWLYPAPTTIHPAHTTLPPLWEPIVRSVIAVPIAEEVVFRGVLARSLATTWSTRAAVVWSAAAFAIYHRAPYLLVSTF